MPLKDKEARKIYQREYYRNGPAHIDKLRAERGNRCERCGYDEYPKILQFHHRNPEEKKFGVAQAWTRAEQTIRKEADKCDLLCPNCHTVDHYKKNGKINNLCE